MPSIHLDQLLPALSGSTAALLLYLAVIVGVYTVAGSLRAAIRDKDFSAQEIARFLRSQFFSPQYGALLGLVAAVALAPDATSRQGLLALLATSVFAVDVQLSAKVFTTLKALAGFPSADYPAPTPLPPSAPAPVK